MPKDQFSIKLRQQSGGTPLRLKHTPYKPMKKRRLNVGLLAAVALAVTQGANAALLVGFYDFRPGTKPINPTDDPAEYKAAGYNGWVYSPEQSTTGDGGCYNGVYGNSDLGAPYGPSGISTGETAAQLLPPGNGAGTIRTIPDPSNPLFSVLTFWVTNTGTIDYPLEYLFFDAAEPDNGGVVNQLLKVSWSRTGDLATSTPFWDDNPLTPKPPPIEVVAQTAGNLYQGYRFDISSLTLAPGEKLAFLFTADHKIGSGNYDSDTIWVDNVAITAIPEPSSVLGLGCVLASGLMLRNRRKPVI